MPVATLSRWISLCQKAGLPSSSHAWHARLMTAWTEPQRHYHDLTHLEECLSWFDKVAALCEAPCAVELALWFHDAVYDPKAPDNEEKSAEMAEEFLHESGESPALKANVALLIMATKTHQADGNPDAEVMLDIDLSILGQPRERFSQYEEAIRQEYAWVPWETYLAKRTDVLKSFLGRDAIYQTTFFRDHFELQARNNLQCAITTLKTSSVS